MATVAERVGSASPAGRTGISLPTFLMWALTILVALLTVSPVLAVLVGAFRDAPPGQAGSWSLNGLTRVLSDPTMLSVVWTSIWLNVTRAVLATAIAIVIAWILARTDCPFRTPLQAAIVLSFFFPVLGKLMSWQVLASPRSGYLNQLLRSMGLFSGDEGPLNIFSYGGVIFVSVIGWATVLIMFLLPAFRAMDASLEESARMSGATPFRMLRRVIVPVLRPAIVSVFILALVRMFSSFEIEYFLGSRVGIFVFTNKIYERLDVLPADYQGAFTLVLILLVLTFMLVFINWKMVGSRSYTTVTGRSYSARPMLLGKWKWVAFSVVALFVLVSLVMPALVLIQASFAKRIGVDIMSASSYSLDRWIRIFNLEIPRRAIINSIIMGVTASTIGMILYTLIAYVVTRTQFAGRRLLDLAAWVPWAVPTLVLGMGVLWSVTLTPLAVLYGTLAIMILANIIRGFPAETRIMTSTMVQISKELEESARIHGASWLTTFRRVWLPLLRNGFIMGWIISFTISFSDLALVVFLYGPDSTVLPTLFLSLWRAGELEMASAAALINTAVVMAVVGIMLRVTKMGLPSRLG